MMQKRLFMKFQSSRAALIGLKRTRTAPELRVALTQLKARMRFQEYKGPVSDPAITIGESQASSNFNKTKTRTTIRNQATEAKLNSSDW